MDKKFSYYKKQEVHKQLTRLSDAMESSKEKKLKPLTLEETLDVKRGFFIEETRIDLDSILDKLHIQLLDLCEVAEETNRYIKVVNLTLSESKSKIDHVKAIGKYHENQMKYFKNLPQDCVSLP